ncbi:MAG: peptidoglycan DD-metalloendopeptidase family protein [Candidatus Falkowbacteria bacterium]
MNKTIKLIIPILFLGIIFNAQSFVFGQEEIVNREIKELNRGIEENKNKLKDIQERQKSYESALRKKQGEKASLENQLAILDNRIAKAELDIENVEVEINRVNLEIKKININIEDKDNQIKKEKDRIASILRLMRKEDEKSALEIMLINNSFADFINQVKYLEDINSEIGESLDNVKKYKEELEDQKIVLDEKKLDLDEMKKELEDSKMVLISEKANKDFVLEQTQSSEKEYQRLLKLAKEEQAQANSEIVNLEKIVRDKINNLEGKKLEFNDSGLIWPVPKNTITSIFHDPDYPFRYIFEHPGIDIRAAQGTPLKAAASGYVARAKSGGASGYGYIMIVHGDGLATVYGHVSKIYVEEDEYVIQGQTIGASGGLPGTPGAGRLTTGPHLHFEVRLDGIPVNPQEYLP